MIAQRRAAVQRKGLFPAFCAAGRRSRTVMVAIGADFGYIIPGSIKYRTAAAGKGENKMDMEELGYLLFMEAEDKKEHEEEERALLAEDGDGKDDEDE